MMKTRKWLKKNPKSCIINITIFLFNPSQYPIGYAGDFFYSFFLIFPIDPYTERNWVEGKADVPCKKNVVVGIFLGNGSDIK